MSDTILSKDDQNALFYLAGYNRRLAAAQERIAYAAEKQDHGQMYQAIRDFTEIAIECRSLGVKYEPLVIKLFEIGVLRKDS